MIRRCDIPLPLCRGAGVSRTISIFGIASLSPTFSTLRFPSPAVVPSSLPFRPLLDVHIVPLLLQKYCKCRRESVVSCFDPAAPQRHPYPRSRCDVQLVCGVRRTSCAWGGDRIPNALRHTRKRRTYTTRFASSLGGPYLSPSLSLFFSLSPYRIIAHFFYMSAFPSGGVQMGPEDVCPMAQSNPSAAAPSSTLYAFSVAPVLLAFEATHLLPLLRHTVVIICQVFPHLHYNLAYVGLLVWMYLFHSPFRVRSKERLDWYAQVTKVLQAWCMLDLMLFHVVPTYLQRMNGAEAGAVFFPMFAVSSVLFLLQERAVQGRMPLLAGWFEGVWIVGSAQLQPPPHPAHHHHHPTGVVATPAPPATTTKLGRFLAVLIRVASLPRDLLRLLMSVRVSYAPTLTMWLLNSLLMALLGTAHYGYCAAMALSIASSEQPTWFDGRLVYAVCPDESRGPHWALLLLSIEVVGFIMYDMLYKTYHGGDVFRGLLWCGEVSHSDPRGHHHHPAAEGSGGADSVPPASPAASSPVAQVSPSPDPAGAASDDVATEPPAPLEMVPWYSALIASTALQLFVGSKLTFGRFDYRTMESQQGPKLFRVAVARKSETADRGAANPIAGLPRRIPASRRAAVGNQDEAMTMGATPLLGGMRSTKSTMIFMESSPWDALGDADGDEERGGSGDPSDEDRPVALAAAARVTPQPSPSIDDTRVSPRIVSAVSGLAPRSLPRNRAAGMLGNSASHGSLSTLPLEGSTSTASMGRGVPQHRVTPHVPQVVGMETGVPSRPPLTDVDEGGYAGLNGVAGAQEPFWFDFTADVGDGYNSSYCIARLLAQPQLRLRDATAIARLRRWLPRQLLSALPKLLPSAAQRAVNAMSLTTTREKTKSSDEPTGEAPPPSGKQQEQIDGTTPKSPSGRSPSSAPQEHSDDPSSSNQLNQHRPRRSVSAERVVASGASTRGGTAGLLHGWLAGGRTRAGPSRHHPTGRGSLDGGSRPGEPSTLKVASDITLPRGQLLLLGGDLAYPSPTDEIYRDRFYRPYCDAFPPSPREYDGTTLTDETVFGPHTVLPKKRAEPLANSEDALRAEVVVVPVPGQTPPVNHHPPAPRGGSGAPRAGGTTASNAPSSSSAVGAGEEPLMFAIPGNHDWIDGLDTYRNTVLTLDRFAGWTVPQRTSYFAIELPVGDWWVLALDLGLAEDIDPMQMQYFLDVCGRVLSPTSSVIILTHEPNWVLDAYHRPGQPSTQPRAQTIRRALGTRLRLCIAGDVHNYSRYEASPAAGAATPSSDDRLADSPNLTNAKTPQPHPSKAGGQFPSVPQSTQHRSAGTAALPRPAASSVEGLLANRKGISVNSASGLPSTMPPLDHAPVLVVSGGGGAFAHGTTLPGANLQYLGRAYTRRAAFPDHAAPFHLLTRIFGFRLVNWQFDLVGGVLYFCLVGSLLTERFDAEMLNLDTLWPQNYGGSLTATPPLAQGSSSAMALGHGWHMAIAAVWGWIQHTLHLLVILFTETVLSCGLSVGLTVVLCASVESKLPAGRRLLIGLTHGAVHIIVAVSLLAVVQVAAAMLLHWRMVDSTSEEWNSALVRHVSGAIYSAAGYAFGASGRAAVDTASSWWITQLGTRILGSLDVIEGATYLAQEMWARGGANSTSTIAAAASAPLHASIVTSSSSPSTRGHSVLFYLHALMFYWMLAAPAVAAVVGAYLCVCVTCFGSCWDATYSAFRIEDFKHFIRFKIHPTTRELVGYVIAVDKVPTSWERDPAHDAEVAKLQGAHLNRGGAQTAAEARAASMRFPSVWRPRPKWGRGLTDIKGVLQRMLRGRRATHVASSQSAASSPEDPYVMDVFVVKPTATNLPGGSVY